MSPELIEVSGCRHDQWQQPFDAALTDVFQVQADIAGRVAQALDVALGTATRGAGEKPTANLAAYDAFLKGEEAWSGTADPATLRQALRLLTSRRWRSTPALRWPGPAARRRIPLLQQREPHARAGERGSGAAERALALAPDRPEGTSALGDYYRASELDHARTLEEYAGRAHRPRTPSCSARRSRSRRWALGRGARAPEAGPAARPPLGARCAHVLAHVLLLLGSYPEAREALRPRARARARQSRAHRGQGDGPAGQGDLRARGGARAAAAGGRPTALVAYLANY